LSPYRQRNELGIAGVNYPEPAATVDHDVGDVVAREQRLKRAESEDVVADVIEQIFLLGDRQHQILDGDDLMDDVPDFLARALGVELGQRGKVNRFDQGAEDQRLGLKISLRSSFGLNRRGLSGRSLGRLVHHAHGRDARQATGGLTLPLRLPNMGSVVLACRTGGSRGISAALSRD
jgi:hypothetical protein